jgi:hypothetical protein
MTEPNVTPSADTTRERHAAEANTTRHELVAAQGVCLATALMTSLARPPRLTKPLTTLFVRCGRGGT